MPVMLLKSQPRMDCLVILVICCFVLCSSKHNLRDRSRRRAQSEVVRNLYNKTALEFLKERGQTYKLFDQFFFSGNQSGRIVQTSAPSSTDNASRRYRTLDYETFPSWGIATARVRPEYAALRFQYKPPASSEEIMMYNNKFRYGPEVDDRFMWIGFDRDPWTESTPDSPAKVFFVGANSQLPEIYEYFCVFHSFRGDINSTVTVKRHLQDILARPTLNSIVSCPIPHAVVDGVSLYADHLELDLVRRQISTTPEAMPVEWLLADIHVPRLHRMDRRRFKHVVQTMVEVLNDVMVLEWMVYNIMLGVEHFYLYYNAKSTDFDIERSILRPFLDANIVTLVYFPFLHPVHYNMVQQAAFNAFHNGFGRYVDWVGYWDVDEFFLPGSTFVPYLQQPPQPYTAPILPAITAKRGGTNEPAIMFDTLDMDCAENSTNFYAGGDNLALMPGSVLGPAFARVAVTTHCLRTGFFFRELQMGHGKMLVCPSRMEYILSPHRDIHYYTWWSDANDGVFRHFNRFRNTVGAINMGMFTAAQIGVDTSLRNFTLASFKAILGIEYKP